MPSSIHNVIVELIEAHPEVLAYLLSLAGAPLSGPLVPTAGTRTQTVTIEARVDRAFLVGDSKTPKSFLLAEVQLDPKQEKRFAWPLYVELARTRYRCEGGLVVLTFAESVRRWIDKTIAPPSGEHGCLRQMKPLVLAVDEIDAALLLRSDMPYLAQLAVAGHAKAPDAPSIAEKAVDITLSQLPERLAAEQLDAILGMVDAALRAHLEQRVMEHREYRSELFRGIYQQGAAEGRAEGKAEGKAEGEAKGKAKGKAEGRVEGKADSILKVLSARGIPVPSSVRERILTCTSTKTLDQWLLRALTASTAEAVITGRIAPKAATPPAAKRSARRPAR